MLALLSLFWRHPNIFLDHRPFFVCFIINLYLLNYFYIRVLIFIRLWIKNKLIEYIELSKMPSPTPSPAPTSLI